MLCGPVMSLNERPVCTDVRRPETQTQRLRRVLRPKGTLSAEREASLETIFPLLSCEETFKHAGEKAISEWHAFYNSWQRSDRGQEFSTSFRESRCESRAVGGGAAAALALGPAVGNGAITTGARSWRRALRESLSRNTGAAGASREQACKLPVTCGNEPLPSTWAQPLCLHHATQVVPAGGPHARQETRLFFLAVSGAGRNTQVHILMETVHDLPVLFDLLVFQQTPNHGDGDYRQRPDSGEGGQGGADGVRTQKCRV